MSEPAFVEEQRQIIASLRRTYLSGRTRPFEWRIEQLNALRKCLHEHSDQFCAALKSDLNKHPGESKLTEFAMVFEDIELTVNNLAKWMKPTSVAKPSVLVFGMDSLQLVPEPYGVVAIISPWNYPVQLSLVAMVGAIAAGNCMVLKPSECAPAIERVFVELLPQYLDEQCFQVITGGIPETTALLENKFDYIFYTGSTAVGKIVMAAAAKHLTPVTLELGGKSPVIVDKTADIPVAGRRLAWGKLLNSGQSCIAPDYVLVEASVEQQLIDEVIKAARSFYGDDAKKSDSYGRIIAERHFDRISRLIDGSEVVYGGERDRSQRYIAPTIVRAQPSDPVMQEEIFGPVLAVVAVESVEEAVNFINDRDKPLASYMFSSDKKAISFVQEMTSAGAFVTNDTMIQASVNTLPFGGVGPSGIGGYHGKFSFETFSHMKPCVHKYPGLEFANDVRYAPYTDTKINRILWLLGYPSEAQRPMSLVPWMVLVSVVVVLCIALYLR